MNESSAPRAQIVYRLSEISALGLGKFSAIMSLLGSIVYAILLVLDYGRLDPAKGLAIVATALASITLAGFLGGLLLATLYNVLARYLGGLQIRLVHVDESEAAGGDSPGLKHCPECQAEIRADRSFCPECDHTFTVRS